MKKSSGTSKSTKSSAPSSAGKTQTYSSAAAAIKGAEKRGEKNITFKLPQKKS